MSIAPARMIRSVLGSLLGESHGGRRDLYAEFGYDYDLDGQTLEALYRRNGLASRIVRAFPAATWSEPPTAEDEAGDSADDSEFVAAWDDLTERFNLAHYLERADRLSQRGFFGLLVLGLNDGEDMEAPIGGGDMPPSGQLPETSAPLIFLRPVAYHNVIAVDFDREPTSPRFGLPETYTVQMGAPVGHGVRGTQSTSVKVHWTRTIHVAETLEEDEVYAWPRIASAYNWLTDVAKVSGAAAETFWLNARRGRVFRANPDADLDQNDVDQLKEQADELDHQLRRNIFAQGFEVQELGAQAVDPRGTFDTLVDLVAGTTGIPKRILLGNEAGELASSQDETQWARRIDERRRSFVSPMILRPLVERLIATGNLPEPQGAWSIGWDRFEEQSDQDKANSAQTWTAAMKNYADSGIEDTVTPEEFRTEYLGLPETPPGGFPETEDDSQEPPANTIPGFPGARGRAA